MIECCQFSCYSRIKFFLRLMARQIRGLYFWPWECNHSILHGSEPKVAHMHIFYLEASVVFNIEYFTLEISFSRFAYIKYPLVRDVACSQRHIYHDGWRVNNCYADASRRLSGFQNIFSDDDRIFFLSQKRYKRFNDMISFFDCRNV